MLMPFNYMILPSFCMSQPCACNSCISQEDDSDTQYLAIYRGDDTNALGGTGFAFTVEAPLDTMDGYEVEFKFLDKVVIVSEFTKTEDNKFLFFVQFSQEDTLKFPYCWQCATMAMIEKSTEEGVADKRKTISNNILIHVTDNLDEVYDSTTEKYTAAVQPGSFFGALEGITFDLNASLEDRMDAIAKIFNRGDGEVVAREPDDDNSEDGE